MEVGAAMQGDQVIFNCPGCGTLRASASWAGDVAMSMVCSDCGIAFSVRNPAVITAATSPAVMSTVSGAPRFCGQCGTRLGEGQAFCAACGTAADSQAAGDLGRRLAATSADAFGAVRRLATDPVGGLSAAYEALGHGRAQAAGAALCVLFAIASAIGVTAGARNWLGSLFSVTSGGFAGFLKLTLFFAVVPAVLIAVCFAARKLARATPSVSADVFTAGTAVLPIATAVLLSGVFGAANFEVMALLLTFGWIYFLLMLFAGMTRVGGVAERAAVPLTPVVVIVTAWLCKVIFVAALS